MDRFASFDLPSSPTKAPVIPPVISEAPEGQLDEAASASGASVEGGFGCLGTLLMPHPSQTDQQLQALPGKWQALVGVPPFAGMSLSPRDPSIPELEVSSSYEDGAGTHYRVRSLDYRTTRIKEKSADSIYRLVAADVLYSDKKQNHIAAAMRLPEVSGRRHPMGPGEACFPPLLVVNIQLPSYAPTMIGGKTDGPGVSIVYFFALPEDFDPAAFPNQKALGLLKRLVQGSKEADGTKTRERFKMIPRVVNVEDWASKGPLSYAEHKLLSNYNETPILSRPQHTFFNGPNGSYLEIDLDIHSYSFFARQAFLGYMQRLSTVVFEVAFVIQGNSSDELPEQVLGCGRIYRADFSDRPTLEITK